MTVVDLFAGLGGASLGLHRAGLAHVETVDYDEAACATLTIATGGGLFARPHHACHGAAPVVRWGSVECLLLQGLPGDWPVQGKEEDRYRQAGNAVPPPMAEALARCLP